MKYQNLIFVFSIIMLIYSCGKDISNAVASSGSPTAPWRITRGEIAYSSTIAQKDAICSSEFGADFIVGRYKEGVAYLGNSMAGVNMSDGEFRSTPISYDGSTTLTDTDSVFCIRK